MSRSGYSFRAMPNIFAPSVSYTHLDVYKRQASYAIEGDAEEVKSLYKLMKRLQEQKEPVSYTHLDVYKRQVMDLFEDDMELITLYHHIPTHADKFGHSTCAYSNPAFGPVSYTHLDVYKRQV